MKVTVDEDRCRGHGVCTMICPEVFALNADGYSTVQAPVVRPQYEEAVGEAVRNCPELAITAH